MFSWLFGQKNTDGKVVAILDVGSGSVGGALGVLRQHGPPELLFAIREELPMRMTRKSAEMAKDATAASRSVLDQVRKAAALWNEANRITPKRIEHLAIFLAAPWSSGTIRTLRFARAKPFAMSSEVLRKMLNDETRVAMSHQNTGLEVLERVATGLKLNGYPVNSVSDALANEAEVTLATSLSPKAFLLMLVHALGEMPHGTKKSFHSFGLPTAHILPRVISSISDALVIDAGAEISEIIHLKDGVPVNRATAPVGTHMLLRTLQAHGRMAKKEAETTLKLARLDGTRLSETHISAITSASREWAKAVLLAAASITEGTSAPMFAYIFSDAPAQPWLVDALSKEPYPKETAPIQTVTPLTSKEFKDKVALRGAMPDPFLCAELIFLDERFDENQALELVSPRDPLLVRPHETPPDAILQESVPVTPVSTLSSKL